MIGRFPYQSFNLIPEANILVLQEVKNHPDLQVELRHFYMAVFQYNLEF